MLELAVLFALLPVAAAAGWLAAQRKDHRRRERGSPALSGRYFRGLNYLLNEESDKAVEVFLSLAEVNQDTVETHMALGSLFRRRGEMDKAIRFHKHIMTQPDLNEEQRAQALLELGEDYMRAGLLDRAERLFSELLSFDPRSGRAARRLLDIYQQEKDWDKAIEQARNLQRLEGENSNPLIAHFHCELAIEALGRGAIDDARRALRQARRCDPRHPRPRLIEADLAAREEHWGEAASRYREACELDPDALVGVVDPLIEAHRRAGQADQLVEWLAALGSDCDMTTPTVALARLQAESDPQLAVRTLLDHLSRRPTVRGVEFLMDLLDRQGASLDDVGPDLIRTLMQRLLDGQPRFRCRHCGFSGNAYHWLCPSCRRWNTTRAIEGVLGE